MGAFEERPELESLAREVGILQEGGIPSMRKNAMNADAAGSLLDLSECVFRFLLLFWTSTELYFFFVLCPLHLEYWTRLLILIYSRSDPC